MVESWYLQIKVDSLQYVSGAQALLRGMVGSNFIATDTRVNVPETSLWFKMVKSDDNSTPVICAVFNTFGHIEGSVNDLEVTFDLTRTDGKVSGTPSIFQTCSGVTMPYFIIGFSWKRLSRSTLPRPQAVMIRSSVTGMMSIRKLKSNKHIKNKHHEKLIVLFSAVAALAACSKNEVVPAVSGENVEISYKVAPRTKADPQTFDTNNKFASWAYYLPSGKNWDANHTEAKIYIGKEGEEGATISYGNNVWKDQDASYYWPKEGKLTFFAYSLNSKSLTNKFGTDTHFTCLNHESQYGIFGSLNLDKHPNTDFS